MLNGRPAHRDLHAGARLDLPAPVALSRQADQMPSGRRWRLVTPGASMAGTELAISFCAGIAVPRLRQGAAGTNHFGPGGVLFRDGQNSMPSPMGWPSRRSTNRRVVAIPNHGSRATLRRSRDGIVELVIAVELLLLIAQPRRFGRRVSAIRTVPMIRSRHDATPSWFRCSWLASLRGVLCIAVATARAIRTNMSTRIVSVVLRA
ncbi:hypothetical protein ACVIW0_003992 [Bradyrhizobium sp. USDA 4454]